MDSKSENNDFKQSKKTGKLKEKEQGKKEKSEAFKN